MLRDLIIQNRSCRGYDRSYRFTREKLLEFIDLARLTASSVNLQPLKYCPVWEEEKLQCITALTKWARALPKLSLPKPGTEPTGYIIICQDTAIASNLQTFQKDVGIAAQTILLAAVEQGLAGCMIGSFTPKDIKAALHLPESVEVLLVLALGRSLETIVLEDVVNSTTRYYRDSENVHHVPKRTLDDVVI